MGKASRDKGKRGELELVHVLRDYGFAECRRAQQYCGTADSADIVGLQGIHIECKRSERLSIYQALAQSRFDCLGDSDIPVVMHRRNGHPWVVISLLDDWMILYRAYINCQSKK